MEELTRGPAGTDTSARHSGEGPPAHRGRSHQDYRSPKGKGSLKLDLFPT